jgi:tetratricopeptide (TPR) repeat protein
MRGVLLWHEGDYDGAAELLERAFEMAEQVGRSEVAFESLQALAATLRDRGDYADADQTLVRSLDLCERAGLVAQSVEAISARAITLMQAGRADAARESAEEAARLGERLRYPVGKAAALEAVGMVAEDSGTGSNALEEARDAWASLGRPMDAARCEYLRGLRLRDTDPERARKALDTAANSAEELGVHHLAELARAAVTG